MKFIRMEDPEFIDAFLSRLGELGKECPPMSLSGSTPLTKNSSPRPTCKSTPRSWTEFLGLKSFAN